jgi:hypothetical protein
MNEEMVDFFRRYHASVTGSGPNLPLLPPWEEVSEPEADQSVFLDEEVAQDKWEPKIVLEAPIRKGEAPVRFIDGAQHHRTVLWLRSPSGSPIPLVIAEIGAVAIRLNGRQFLREAVQIEQVLSFVGDSFPWEEIEAFSRAILHHQRLQLRVVLANRPQEPHHPFDYEVMRAQAVARIRQEMATWEKLLVFRNSPEPTLVDGPLHRVMGEPLRDGPLNIGVIKTHAADYLHEQGWRTLYDLNPGQRTPYFRITGKGGSKEGRFPVVSWFLKLAGGPRLAPNWGFVRVEVPWNQFEHLFNKNKDFIGRLSRWLIDARCRQESYGRMAVSLEPIVRAEDVIKPLFSSLDALSHRLYRQAGILRSSQS